MNQATRRAFLTDVSRGMLIAGIGPALASDLGISSAFAEDDSGELSFGKMEPLVRLMQETPLDRLQGKLISKLQSGTVSLKDLVTAGSLANARTFGGQDYVGYHAMMALLPSYQMSRELGKERCALPVLKVLYRNTSQIHQHGGRPSEVLHPVKAGEATNGSDSDPRQALRAAVRAGNMDDAERIFATLAGGPLDDAYNDLVVAYEEDTNVHRIVLTHRSWATLDLVGKDWAHTLLRQAVRFCVDSERNRISRGYPEPALRSLMPKLLDEYRLLGRSPGSRRSDDAWVDKFANTVLTGGKEQAAESVAAAIAEGISLEDIGEAISLAANQQVLRDPGRREGNEEKPAGSVHGDSIGVHSSDAVNAWRNVARNTNDRNAVASMLVAGYYVAHRSPLNDEPYPLPEQLEAVKATKADELLNETESAIRGNDQFRAAAVVQRYGEKGHDARAMFDLLLNYAISEDGALHAEKYYRTVAEEFASTRPVFRWRQLVALARVTASEFGRTAPGYLEARQLLGIA